MNRNHLVDGVTSKPREDVGDGVFGALKVLDFDRVLHQRRYPSANSRATFRLFQEKPRERLVIGAEDDRASEKIYVEVLSSGDDCESLAFKRRIILLGR